ncbi:unnamed protein product [Ceratitis capitata]|uniref:(Mediterranean fruit fly) hypothetical protein n=1 Tax=Ceratitis capitata TaxID=7213 RepID=A0A811UW39_CERCA|nr:unnamed protein product [Ceratitis capitata]
MLLHATAHMHTFKMVLLLLFAVCCLQLQLKLATCWLADRLTRLSVVARAHTYVCTYIPTRLWQSHSACAYACVCQCMCDLVSLWLCFNAGVAAELTIFVFPFVLWSTGCCCYYYYYHHHFCCCCFRQSINLRIA